MKKIKPAPFLLILTAILLVMSLPRAFSEKGRSTLTAFLAPLWEEAAKIKNNVEEIIGTDKEISSETQRLRTENLTLRQEVKHLEEIIRHELYLTRSGAQRTNNWQKLLASYTSAIPARIIFRDPSSWNSSCWINVGKNENDRLGKTIVAKNSPIVVGYSLVGVVDFVGVHQSRIRLLTDSGLTPAVRAVRGEPKRRMLAEQLNLMMDALMEQDHLFATTKEKMELIETLEKIEQQLQSDSSALYLAKGYLSGSGHPMWRGQGHLLKGTGFNLDFTDSLSPSLDLRTGARSGSSSDSISILQSKDLLITTGLDGVFPPGLHVAEVKKIFPLKEGDYFYELEAIPAAGSLDELSMVYVLPPIGYDPEEAPPLMGWE